MPTTLVIRRGAVQWTDTGIGALVAAAGAAAVSVWNKRKDIALQDKTTRTLGNAEVTVRFVEFGENLLQDQREQIANLTARLDRLQQVNDELREKNAELHAVNNDLRSELQGMKERMVQCGTLPPDIECPLLEGTRKPLRQSGSEPQKEDNP